MLEFKPEDEIAFLHKEITEAIIGSAFEVYNHLGYGFPPPCLSTIASNRVDAARV